MDRNLKNRNFLKITERVTEDATNYIRVDTVDPDSTKFKQIKDRKNGAAPFISNYQLPNLRSMKGSISKSKKLNLFKDNIGMLSEYFPPKLREKISSFKAIGADDIKVFDDGNRIEATIPANNNLRDGGLKIRIDVEDKKVSILFPSNQNTLGNVQSMVEFSEKFKNNNPNAGNNNSSIEKNSALGLGNPQTFKRNDNRAKEQAIGAIEKLNFTVYHYQKFSKVLRCGDGSIYNFIDIGVVSMENFFKYSRASFTFIFEKYILGKNVSIPQAPPGLKKFYIVFFSVIKGATGCRSNARLTKKQKEENKKKIEYYLTGLLANRKVESAILELLMNFFKKKAPKFLSLKEITFSENFEEYDGENNSQPGAVKAKIEKYTHCLTTHATFNPNNTALNNTAPSEEDRLSIATKKEDLYDENGEHIKPREKVKQTEGNKFSESATSKFFITGTKLDGDKLALNSNLDIACKPNNVGSNLREIMDMTNADVTELCDKYNQKTTDGNREGNLIPETINQSAEFEIQTTNNDLEKFFEPLKNFRTEIDGKIDDEKKQKKWNNNNINVKERIKLFCDASNPEKEKTIAESIGLNKKNQKELSKTSGIKVKTTEGNVFSALAVLQEETLQKILYTILSSTLFDKLMEEFKSLDENLVDEITRILLEYCVAVFLIKKYIEKKDNVGRAIDVEFIVDKYGLSAMNADDEKNVFLQQKIKNDNEKEEIKKEEEE
ncbi:MAG: hypothetical protein LBB09_02565, partial [Rickettsiales bacterium]|nr:hypothetical protein [Rickettsiales bacterium]